MKTIQVRSGTFSFFCSALLAYSPVGLAAIVNNCDEPSLRAALAGGGTVTFACDGTIVLTNTLTISQNTILDGSGRQVTISGGKAVHIFEVLSNVSLSLNHLTLAHGWAAGTNGTSLQQPATAGQGGAIRVQGGTLNAVDCMFATNNAIGGKAPNISLGTMSGALGEGGAIFAAFAQLRLTNCVFLRNTATGGAGSDAPILQASPGDGGPGRGGSISAISSQIVLAGGMLSNNAANVGAIGLGFLWSGNLVDTWGGALYAENCTCTATGLTLRGNAATAAGGACFLLAGEAAFASCVFEANAATSSSQSRGGAIRSVNTRLGLVDCVLRNNAAQGAHAFIIRSIGRSGGFAEGGAVVAAGGDLRATNCTFAGNLAQGGNGMIAGFPGSQAAGSAQGGGLFHTGTGTVVNCTFAGNAANHGLKVFPQSSGGRGGALASTGGVLTVHFSTIASNVVSDNANAFVTNSVTTIFSQGAGCFVADGSLLLASSILSGNFATLGGSSGNVPANAAGPVADGGHNLSSDATPVYTAPSSRNSIDPLLGPLTDHGGPTPTMALRPASPAINAGDSLSCPPTDQRGIIRPQLGECDIGAYELPDGFYILALQDTGPDTFLLNGLGIPNQSYRVEFSGNLTNWMDAASGFTGPDGRVSVEVDRGLQPRRFYRIAVP